jgi:hypothetical protein
MTIIAETRSQGRQPVAMPFGDALTPRMQPGFGLGGHASPTVAMEVSNVEHRYGDRKPWAPR